MHLWWPWPSYFPDCCRCRYNSTRLTLLRISVPSEAGHFGVNSVAQDASGTPMAPTRRSDLTCESRPRSTTHLVLKFNNLHDRSSSNPPLPKRTNILALLPALPLATHRPASSAPHPASIGIPETRRPIILRKDADGPLQDHDIVLNWLIPTLFVWLFLSFLVTSEDLHMLIFEVIGIRLYRLLARCANVRGPFHMWRSSCNRSVARKKALHVVQRKKRNLRRDLRYDILPAPTKSREGVVPRSRRRFTITDREPLGPLHVDDHGKSTTIFAPMQDTLRIHPQLFMTIDDSTLSAQSAISRGGVVGKQCLLDEDIAGTGIPDWMPWRLRIRQSREPGSEDWCPDLPTDEPRDELGRSHSERCIGKRALQSAIPICREAPSVSRWPFHEPVSVKSELARNFGISTGPNIEETVSIPLSGSSPPQIVQHNGGNAYAQRGFILPHHQLPLALFHPTFCHALVRLQRRRIVADLSSRESEFSIARLWREAEPLSNLSDLSFDTLTHGSSDIDVAQPSQSSVSSRATTTRGSPMSRIFVHSPPFSSRPSLGDVSSLDLSDCLLGTNHLQVPWLPDHGNRHRASSIRTSPNASKTEVLTKPRRGRGSFTLSRSPATSPVRENNELPATQYPIPNVPQTKRKPRWGQNDMSSPALIASASGAIPRERRSRELLLGQEHQENLRHLIFNSTATQCHGAHTWNNGHHQPFDPPRLTTVPSPPTSAILSPELNAQASAPSQQPNTPGPNHRQTTKQSLYLRHQPTRSFNPGQPSSIAQKQTRNAETRKDASTKFDFEAANPEPNRRAQFPSAALLSCRSQDPRDRYLRSANRRTRRPQQVMGASSRGAVGPADYNNINDTQDALALGRRQGVLWMSSGWSFVKHERV